MTSGAVRALVVDLDGVLTDTASVHARAWKRTFDDYLRARAERTGAEFVPFDEAEDYRLHVDGKPRYEGASSFLGSRGIRIPFGDPSDSPEVETVCGVANRKNEYFRLELREHEVAVYETSRSFLEQAKRDGLSSAVVTSSRNGRDVLAAAGLEGLFDIVLDGTDAAREGLAGKPDPATFVEAAHRLNVEPKEAGVIEDAIAGVEAGRRGKFGLVIGVDRLGHPEGLRKAGADIVVDDLGELLNVVPGCPRRAHGERRLRELPSALEAWGELAREFEARPPVLFLDYDGTVTPIVERPEAAFLDPGMRDVIARLARRMQVTILSGRDTADVRERVGVDGIYYAGSHGFDILGPDGVRVPTRYDHDLERYLSELASAEAVLREGAAAIPGMLVERKKYALAAHFRLVSEGQVPEVEQLVRAVAERHPALRTTTGKMILELRPDIDWDKGKALLLLLDVIAGGETVEPVFLGDDLTDEDGFRVLSVQGMGIVVGVEDRETFARYRLRDVRAVHAFLTRLEGIGRRA